MHIGRVLTLVNDSARLHSLLQVVSEKWRVLGLLLGFKPEALHNMASSAGGMESYLHKLITGWLSGDASQHPTLESLIAALRHPNISEEGVAAKLLEGLKSKI